MSTLSQFSPSGFGTSFTVNEFVVQDIRLCGFFDELNDNPLGTRISNTNGFLICKASSTAWIVSPRCSEVSRTWYLRNDAITLTETCTTIVGGWFIPTVSQLQNPGYTCRTFWDSFSSAFYWSSTECDATLACRVLFTNGTAYLRSKANTYCVRAFRCVTY
jgi:hypothetical protein